MHKAICLIIVLVSIVCIVPLTALSDNYPIFLPDSTIPGLYYWTSENQVEEDIASEAESEAIKSLVLPSNLQWLDGYHNVHLEALEQYIVEESSPFLACIDGVLFTKDRKTLLAYPRNKSCEEYEIPEGVIGIGKNAFAQNAHLRTVTFSEDVEWIGQDAFSGCSALKTINLNSALTCIEDRAFAYCQNLTELRCPDALKVIGFQAFYMSGLSNVMLNDGLVCIMGEAFFTHCFGKAEIFMPKTVLYVERTIFSEDEEITILTSRYAYHSHLILDGATITETP